MGYFTNDDELTVTNSCCENKAGELAVLRSQQGRILYIVFSINITMFLIEFISGWLARSTALLADSLDMFGDASVYALTLFVLHKSDRACSGAALVKGIIMVLFGLLVISDAASKGLLGVQPEAKWMGFVGLVALIAYLICFLLLYKHRSADLNMHSVWLCSRNDLIANIGVIIAAVLVFYTSSLWPDVIIGLVIAVLFLHSAWLVITEARKEWLANSTNKV